MIDIMIIVDFHIVKLITFASYIYIYIYSEVC